jgi:hypothetical protein
MSIGLLRNSQRRFLLPLNVSMSLRTRTFLAMVALLALFVPGASATCGSSAQRMVPSVSSALPLPLLQEPTSGSVLAQERQDGKEPSMTGLWKTVFVAGGAVVNLGFNTWHSDGTEWALDGTFPLRAATCALGCGRGSGTGLTSPSIRHSTTTPPIRTS